MPMVHMTVPYQGCIYSVPRDSLFCAPRNELSLLPFSQCLPEQLVLLQLNSYSPWTLLFPWLPSGSRSSPMESTCFDDLLLSCANRPSYAYCHQACCEHGWYVSDIRGVQASDPQCRSAYPRVTRLDRAQERWRCGICRQVGGCLKSKWVVLPHSRA